MRKSTFSRFIVFGKTLSVLIYIASVADGSSQTKGTALDDYVSRPDTNYSYHLVSTDPGQGQTTFILEMTSQAWLTTNVVDRPLWKHWLLVVKPATVTSAKSLLFISGGANDGKVPKGGDANLTRIALA